MFLRPLELLLDTSYRNIININNLWSLLVTEQYQRSALLAIFCWWDWF